VAKEKKGFFIGVVGIQTQADGFRDMDSNQCGGFRILTEVGFASLLNRFDRRATDDDGGGAPATRNWWRGYGSEA
jgi:hypothetical protein